MKFRSTSYRRTDCHIFTHITYFKLSSS